MLRQKNKLLTIWTDFTRRPTKIESEQYICVVKGQERYILVSPIFRKQIYVGVFEKFGPNVSPLDFFNVTYERYPYAKQVKFIDVTLSAGDCMYVPAYYYVQSKTTYAGDNQESIIITQEYLSHSRVVEMILDGLEGDMLTDNKLSTVDQKMVDWFKSYF